MINNILNDIKITSDQYLIVGCSGGPDSMALLHYLKNNYPNNIVCAHINHNVRKESKKEEKYLKEYCKNNNIIFESITLKKFTTNNFENEARIKRYAFYEQIIKKYKAKYLFLAHHGDDLVETILMKIIRGSNLEGYAGIKRISKRKNYFIIRPFLKYTKKDLIEYNKKYNINYFIDQSNYDKKYTRNRIRHNILPELKKENSLIHLSFLKYSNTLLEYNTYINKEINKNIKIVYKNNYLDIDKFINIDPFIQKNILYRILNNNYENKNNIIKEEHINNIINLIMSPKPNIKINLPNNIKCIKTYNKLYLDKYEEKKENYKIELEDQIKLNNFIIKKINNTKENGNNICKINSKKIKLPLYIRNRKNGDYIEILGLNGKKKVKDIFIDKKIPINKRDKYPLLVDKDDNILWIPNIKKSKFNATKDEFYDIILKYCEKEENNE